MLKLIGKIFKVVCYLLSSFFFLSADIVTFVGVTKSSAVILQEEIKVIVIMICSLLAIIFLVCALAVDHFNNWKRNTGIVIVSVICFVLFSMLSAICFSGVVNIWNKTMSINYISGFAYMLVLGVFAALLLNVSNKS